MRLGDELLAVIRPGNTAGTWTTRFVHSDGVGSVRALTDESGTTTDSRGYEAFGTKNVEAGIDMLAYGFAGEAFQPDSMLAYHRARWMDPRVGRFAGMDPEDGGVLNPLSLHRYMYAGDEPLDQVDPSGAEYDMASIGAAIGADLVLSTLATAKVTEIALDIVCTAVTTPKQATTAALRRSLRPDRTDPAASTPCDCRLREAGWRRAWFSGTSGPSP